jgi:hypothetical protein
VLDTNASLTYVPDTSAPPGINRYVVVQKGQGAPPGSHTQVDQSSDGRTVVVGAVIPQEARLGRNGWKQGDTLDVAFRYADLPIDPRVVRACAVEFYMGTVTQADFAAGLAGGLRFQGDFTAGQQVVSEPLHVVPDDWFDDSGKLRTNMRFEGWVDEWEFDWSPTGQALVRLKCTDNTRLLIDQEMSPLLTIDQTKPIDQAVAQLLANFPRFQGLVVEYRPGGATPPVVGASLGPTSYRPDLGSPGAKHGGATTDKQSVWDFIVEICLLLGHSARVEGTTIIIQRIRTATSKVFPPRYDDPFQGRTWNGSFHPLRTLIWGRNVLSAKGGRKYAKARKNVECRCYLPERKKTLVARQPLMIPHPGGKNTSRAVDALPGDGRADTKYTVITVSGVSDQKTLQTIAQHYYESMNRGELHLKIKTRNLASFGGTNADPDLLDMLAGDRISFLVDRTSLVDLGAVGNTIGDIENAHLSETQGANALTAAGLSPQFSSAYLAALQNVGFQTEYVTKSVELTWSHDKGIDVDIDVVDFVEVALDTASGFDDSALLPGAGQKPNPQTPPAGP